MKKILLLYVLIITVLFSTGQIITSPPQLDREHFFSKSQKQRTGAIVAVSAGTLLMISAFIVAGDDLDGLFDSMDKKNSDLSDILFFGGLSVAAASIPLLIASKKNRNKAISLSYQKKPVSMLMHKKFIQQQMPDLTITISL